MCLLWVPCAADLTSFTLSGGSSMSITNPFSEEEGCKCKTVGPPLHQVLLEWVRKRLPNQTAGSNRLPGSKLPEPETMTLNSKCLSREGKEETVGPKRERVGRQHQAGGPRAWFRGGQCHLTKQGGQDRRGLCSQDSRSHNCHSLLDF